MTEMNSKWRLNVTEAEKKWIAQYCHDFSEGSIEIEWNDSLNAIGLSMEPSLPGMYITSQSNTLLQTPIIIIGFGPPDGNVDVNDLCFFMWDAQDVVLLSQITVAVAGYLNANRTIASGTGIADE